MKTVIKLETVLKVREFIETTRSFESPIDVIKGHYIIDGKSIMGIMSIDCSEEFVVELLSNDASEIDRFAKKMAEFQ